MAREDTKWFALAVVILSLVLFLTLPLSVMIYSESLRLQADIRAESRASVKKIEKLRKELEEERTKEKESKDGNS